MLCIRFYQLSWKHHKYQKPVLILTREVPAVTSSLCAQDSSKHSPRLPRNRGSSAIRLCSMLQSPWSAVLTDNIYDSMNLSLLY